MRCCDGSGPAINYIAGFLRTKQNASVRRSPRRFASSMKKGLLEVLALLRTVLGISCKEAEQRKLSCRSLAHIEPLQISFLLMDLLLLLYKSWSYSGLPVEVSCGGAISASTMSFLSNNLTPQENYGANDCFFKRRLMQHSTGSGKHHAVLNIVNLH